MNKDNSVFWTVIALFVGPFLFCLFFINEGLFHYDSVILARAVEDTYRTGHLHPAVGGRYGIVIINSILYFPFYLFGQNADFLTRLSSVLFYALSLPLFFIFINDLFRDRIQGLFAAILLALTPFYLIPNTYGKEHGMSMFFFLFSMILVNRGGDQKRPGILILASLCYMAALSVRESVLIMFPFYFWLFLKPAIAFRPFRIDIQKERLNGRLLFFLALPLAVLFIFMMIAYLGPVIRRSLIGEEFSASHFCGFFSKILSVAFSNVWRSFPPYFFFLGILGTVTVWQASRYFLLFFFLVWASLIFLYGNFDGYTARYLDMAVLAAHAFVSCFLAWLYRRFRVSAIGVFALLITIQLTHIYPMLEFRRHYDGTLRLASFVNSISPPNAVFIAVDEEPFIEYYGQRKTIRFPLGHWEKLEGFLHEIESLMDRQVPVYLIPPPPVYLLGGTIEKSKFFEVGPKGGIILSELIHKGVLKDVSSTEVSFQLNSELKINLIREIAKGDYSKILDIFVKAIIQCKRKILDRFRVSMAGKVLVENYHRPELGLNVHLMSIYKLDYFGFTIDEFTDKMPASGLLKAIIHDFGISVPEGKDDIEKLNNVLKINGLYKKLSNLHLPRPRPFLIKPESLFTGNEIRRSNRFFLEIVYPQQCPRSKALDISILVPG